MDHMGCRGTREDGSEVAHHVPSLLQPFREADILSHENREKPTARVFNKKSGQVLGFDYHAISKA